MNAELVKSARKDGRLLYFTPTANIVHYHFHWFIPSIGAMVQKDAHGVFSRLCIYSQKRTAIMCYLTQVLEGVAQAPQREQLNTNVFTLREHRQNVKPSDKRDKLRT